jgi:hypothetical protein
MVATGASEEAFDIVRTYFPPSAPTLITAGQPWCGSHHPTHPHQG